MLCVSLPSENKPIVVFIMGMEGQGLLLPFFGFLKRFLMFFRGGGVA